MKVNQWIDNILGVDLTDIVGTVEGDEMFEDFISSSFSSSMWVTHFVDIPFNCSALSKASFKTLFNFFFVWGSVHSWSSTNILTLKIFTNSGIDSFWN